MAEQLLQLLLGQTLALALAVAAVRALQRLLARRFGASAAYLCWLLVPATLAAAALPHPAALPLAIHVGVAERVPGWAARSSAAIAPAHGGFALAALAAWAAGAIGLAAACGWRQSRFRASLVPSTADGALRLPAGSGPALLGLWRPRIVLPTDFEHAFDEPERRLMLLHEGVHLHRGDNRWSLLALALLVVHWFNPVAWWAWRRLRVDQESSCDAAVLRAEPQQAVAVYAGALLKVQGVALAPPLATAWQSSHPLVERIRMLQRHRIPSARHRAGRRLAALSVLLAAAGAYATTADAPPAAASASGNEPSVLTSIDIQETHAGGNAAINCKVLARLGQKVTVRFDTDDVVDKVLHAPVEVQLTVTQRADRQLVLETALLRGKPLTLLSSPRVVTAAGLPARVEVKDDQGRYDLVFSFMPRLTDGRVEMTPGTNDVRKSDARRGGQPASATLFAS